MEAVEAVATDAAAVAEAEATEVEDWEAVARAHGERFGHILPANTMVQASLIGDEYLVEIEADAELS